MYQYSMQIASLDMDSFGISNIELVDGCFGTLLAELSGDQIEDIRLELIRSLRRIVLYTVSTPVSETAWYRHIFQNASMLGITHLKIDLSALSTDTGLAEVLRMAESYGIYVVFEPSVDHPIFTEEFYLSIRTEFTKIIYDPTAFVRYGKKPFLDVLYKCKWKDDVFFLRITDALFDSTRSVALEHGNGEIKECTSTLLARSFGGFFSFVPYRTDAPIRNTVEEFQGLLSRL